MKIFYGGIFVDQNKLKEANIYNPIKLEYYKVENQEKEREEYGIEIVKTEYIEDKVLVENEIIENITDDEKVATNILEILKRNEVTPISANEIIDDLFKM